MSNNYIRLTISERKTIEEMLNKKISISQIAKTLKRSKSTISDEIMRNRTIAKGTNRGKSTAGLPISACEKITKSPRVCNGCSQFKRYCKYPNQIEYSALNADAMSSNRFEEARAGLDISQEDFEKTVSDIKRYLAKKLSPYQISLILEAPSVSQSTIYRWVNKGYANLSRVDLPKSVRYRPRRHNHSAKPTSHGARRSYAAFCNLTQDEIDSACEMDTIIGRKCDSKCILTLYIRPAKFQFALLLNEKTIHQVNKALSDLEKIAGLHLFKELFGVMLTDNGSEFYDYKLLESSSLRNKTNRLKLFYCDVRASGQKGSCEKNHVEIRKIIPKRGISFETLTNWDMATIMSHVNSQPRKSLGGTSPIRMLKMMFGDKINKLLEHYGIREVPLNNLNLSPTILKEESCLAMNDSQ